MIDIEIYDELSPFAQYIIATHPDWLRKAGKSLGYDIIKKTKKGVRSGAPGGKSFPKRLPLKDRKALGYGKAWYGKLVGSKQGERSAVGYEYKDGILKVGWTSRAAKKIGDLLEDGGQKQVTRYLRRLFGNAGKPLKWSTMHTNIPARPIYDPMMDVIRPQMPDFISKKFDGYMTNGTNFAKANRRRRNYKVR